MKKLSIQQRTDTPLKRIKIYELAILKYNSAPLYQLIGLCRIFEWMDIDIFFDLSKDNVFGNEIKFLPELKSFGNNPGKFSFENDVSFLDDYVYCKGKFDNFLRLHRDVRITILMFCIEMCNNLINNKKMVINTKTTQRISRTRAADIIVSETKGRFFTATFVDKKNRLRTINCRYSKNCGTSVLGYVRVMTLDGVKQINLNTLIKITANGVEYKIRNSSAMKRKAVPMKVSNSKRPLNLAPTKRVKPRGKKDSIVKLS